MNIVAAILVDLDTTPLGTVCRLGESLAGEPVIRRTAQRVSRVEGLAGSCVMCPEGQVASCRALLGDVGIKVIGYNAESSPWSSVVSSSRKWSHNGWRGGIGGTTYYDEFVDCRLLLGLLESVEAEAILCVPSSAPLFDPVMASEMLHYFDSSDDDIRMVFAQTPPGLSGLLLEASLVRELAEKLVPIGWVFSYQPDNPRKDLMFEPCCFEVAPDVRYARGRVLADTRRSFETVERLIECGDGESALAICRRLTEWESSSIEAFPIEVEIELTTDDPYPDALLKPRGARVGARGPMDAALVANVVAELIAHDDSLVVLGGFGDPLRHPDFVGVLRAIRSAGGGPFGLAITTTGVDLTDEAIEAMIEYRVDVLNVGIDGWSQEMYGRMHSPNNVDGADLEGVMQRLRRVDELRKTHLSAHPLIVPEMIKSKENIGELDDYYDGWIRTIGAVVIDGYSNRSDQLPDLSVMDMSPPGRSFCHRLRSRCLVLADGSVTMCDQDFAGRHVVGSVKEQTLGEIWNGPKLSALRAAHEAGAFDVNPLCGGCREWHRP